jgi:hypothetical protein
MTGRSTHRKGPLCRGNASDLGIRKKFFFEKKNQKTFVSLAYAAGENRDSDVKVFCFFSSEKKAFSRRQLLPAFTALQPSMLIPLQQNAARCASVLFLEVYKADTPTNDAAKDMLT